MPIKQLTDKERTAEITRLRGLLSSNSKFTAKEIASMRGRVGGLIGKGIPGRKLGGVNGAKSRWAGHTRVVKAKKSSTKKTRSEKQPRVRADDEAEWIKTKQPDYRVVDAKKLTKKSSVKKKK